MSFERRIVSQTPLTEIWDARRIVSAKEIRELNVSDIAELLHNGKVQFVVAKVGEPLKWISPDDCYSFWKSELKIHLADPATNNYLESFPDNYCYFASEWKSDESEPIVLLTMSH